MKVIIAGGRDYSQKVGDQSMVSRLIDEKNITEIVSGGCSGADRFGEMVAYVEKLNVKIFHADWETHGKAAGPIRNEQMAKYADAVILFSGGRGTANMRKLAKQYGLTVLYDAGNIHQ